MASPKNSMYVALRPEKDGKRSQRDLLLEWKETKRFQISAFIQDGISILEEHPELLDTARPGAELARALDRAEELDRAIARIDKLLDIGPKPIIEMYEEISKAAEIAHKARGAPRER